MHCGYGCVGRVHGEDCPSLGLTYIHSQPTYRHQTRAESTTHSWRGDMHAHDSFLRRSRAWAMATNHSHGLHSSLPNSRTRHVAWP